MVIKIKDNPIKSCKSIAGGIYSVGTLDKDYYYIISGCYANVILRKRDCIVLSKPPSLTDGGVGILNAR